MTEKESYLWQIVALLPTVANSLLRLKETPWLNGKHTVFGEVVEGIEIVDAIGLVDVQPQSNKPLDDVMIKTVNIINKGGQKITSFTDAMTKVEQENKEKLAAIAKYADGMKSKI